MEEGGGVAEGLAGAFALVVVDVADQQRHFLDLAGEVIERLQAFRDELRLEDQVARRIAGEREFRGDDEVGTLFQAFAVGLEQALRIPGEVPDHSVDLCDAYLHAPRKKHGERTRKRASTRDRLKSGFAGKKEGRESQIPPESQFAPFLNQRTFLKVDSNEIPPDSESSH